MTQLLKHYLVDRDNPGVFVTTPEQFSRPMFGTIGPDIEGLERVHSLTDENGVVFFLANCPDTLEYSATIPEEQLTEYQNNPDITITSSTQREIEVITEEQTTTQIVYDLVYTKPHIVPETEGEGMKVITQQQWDDEITTFDNRQREKRYDILREVRNQMLELTDWMVIRSTEQEDLLSLEFKTWRQELRNLPNSVQFPSGFPTLPTELQSNTELQELYSKFDEVLSVFMVNDPLLVE